jgi:hypothetical protein
LLNGCVTPVKLNLNKNRRKYGICNVTFIFTAIKTSIMKINLKTGIDSLVFGMKEKDVKALCGEPSRQYKDEDKNTIYLYNDKKLRLTFYQDEDYRLGYVVASHPQLQLGGTAVIGAKWNELSEAIKNNGLNAFEKEEFDSVDNYFNEGNWIIFQVEFGQVVKVELGATINNNDEFDWKF